MDCDHHKRTDLEENMRSVWIDEGHQILAFHPITNGNQHNYTRDDFWNQVAALIKLGYRVM